MRPVCTLCLMGAKLKVEAPVLVGPFTQIFVKVAHHGPCLGRSQCSSVGRQRAGPAQRTMPMFSQRLCCGKKMKRAQL